MNKEVLHKGIAFLARREHSVQELTEKLLAKQFEQGDISEVIAFLQEESYQSDERFAEAYCRNRVTKGYGWQYIRSGLAQKGVDHDTIALVFQNSDVDWFHQAELAYTKRFGSRIITDQKDKAKRIRFLQYRGFSTEQILNAIEQN